MRKLEARINEAEIVYSGPELVLAYARLRVDCEGIGHALHQRDHDADRWVAATALRLGIPLVSNDGIFKDVPACCSRRRRTVNSMPTRTGPPTQLSGVAHSQSRALPGPGRSRAKRVVTVRKIGSAAKR